LWQRFRLAVRVQYEALAIDPGGQQVTACNFHRGTGRELNYDALALSPGARPFAPPNLGRERGLVLDNIEHLDQMLAHEADAENVAIVGAGFNGLEGTENLGSANRSVTILELDRQALAPLDPEMAEPKRG
jgi:NADPH-dependent 2,4-dienoyl-CoA reductase/sulfur reductase-like enzyme